MKFKQYVAKHPKFKNPYFWLSVIGLIFSASGVDFNDLNLLKALCIND